MIQNCLKLIDKDKVFYLKSSHRHDFQEYTFKDGKTVFVDGGLDYCRFGGDFDKEKVLDWNLDENSTLKEICNVLVWGSNGKDGKSPKVYQPIKDLTADHLEAILDWDKNNNICDLHKFVIKHWIEEKRNKRI